MDTLLIELSKDATYIEKAHKQFTKLTSVYPEGLNETLFNSWLILHYADERTVNRMLSDQPDCATAITSARFSLYKSWRNKQYYIFEDIFTKHQYPMLAATYETSVDIDALCLGYIYHLDGENYLVGDFSQIASKHQRVIVQEVMKQYHYAKEQGAYTVEGFLKETPLLLYWAVNTFLEIEAQEPEEDFSVFEVSCTFGEQATLETVLQSPNVLESIIEGVYTLKINALSPIDFCIEGKRLVFDCPTESDAQGLRQWLEGEGEALNIVWLSQRQLTIDDLLDDQEEPLSE